MMAGPMSGVKVVELGVWIAGPAAGCILGDWGADVIKIEPPSGDGMRYALTQIGVDDGEGGFRRQRGDERGQFVDMPFQQENRGKRSVAVALGTPQGQDIVHRLLETADVLVTNLLPDRLKRYGLDAETLEELNPRLIVAAVSAYGEDGPDRDLPGFDGGAFFARGGLMSVVGVPGEEPILPRAGQGDHPTGLSLLAAILGALLLREQTGKGTSVSTSLLRSAQFVLATDMSTVLNDGLQPAMANSARENRPVTGTDTLETSPLLLGLKPLPARATMLTERLCLQAGSIAPRTSAGCG